MSNQLAGFRATGTVTGTGNISLTSIVPNVGSIPASNLTVGQKGWAIVQAGSASTLQREIVYLTYTADTPGAGIMSRGEVKFSTSSNTKINFAADTTVIVEFDVPDDNIVHKLGDSEGWHLIDELATALGLEQTTDDQTVTAGNVTTVLTANGINKRYDVTVMNEADPTEYVSFFVISGPDAGGGSATASQPDNIIEEGDLTLEWSGVTYNVRNNSGSSVTFTKMVRTSRAEAA
jgi:hypothetical protein